MAEHVVMIGNPGTGKSTLLNSLCGEALFKSGVSLNGLGITYSLDVHEHKGVKYCDTPGLADRQLRQAAATAIEKALQQGGEHRILFVVTLESGRVRPEDVTTAQLVLEAAPSIGQSYGLILNKVMPGEYKRLAPTNFQGAVAEFRNSMPSHAQPILCAAMPYSADLDGTDDAVSDLPDHIQQFVANLPKVAIASESVAPIQISHWDAYKQAHEEQLKALREDRDKIEHQLQKLRTDLKKARAWGWYVTDVIPLIGSAVRLFEAAEGNFASVLDPGLVSAAASDLPLKFAQTLLK